MPGRRIPLRDATCEVEIGRRGFMKLLGATMLAAGAAACAEPTGEIVPYVVQPPELVPGVPVHFATAMEIDGYATGLVVESREGRPVKIEGNPEHPASLGAAGVFHQASLLQLYDPDRGSSVKRGGIPRAWLDLAGAFTLEALQRQAGVRGDGLRFLLAPTASPVVADVISRIRDRFPGARVHFYGPLATSHPLDGVRLATGRAAQPVLHLHDADVIVSADADFLSEGPFSLRYARQFADRRRVRGPGDSMNRLYAIEAGCSPTGVAADHRLALRPSEVIAVLHVLLNEISRSAATLPGSAAPVPEPSLAAGVANWARAVARDLLDHRGRAVVVVGDRQPALAHALACLINDRIGAAGRVVTYVEPVVPLADPAQGLAALTDAIQQREVAALVVLGGNPSYDAPADLDVARQIRSVPLTLYSGLYESETAHDAQWYVPAAHYLESWGDARALDGTTSIVQPLIAPLFGGRSLLEVLLLFAAEGRSADQVVRAFWQRPERLGPDADRWRGALQHGVIEGSALQATSLACAWPPVADALASQPASGRGAIDLVLTADPSVHDGRFANNAWLQEMPDPRTKMTWDNAALVSEATAHRVGAPPASIVEISSRGRRLAAPLFVAPGIADDVVIVSLGYGRSGAESVASGVGVNAFALWTTRGFVDPAAAVRPMPDRPAHEFAVTDPHWSLEGRDAVLERTLPQFRADPNFAAAHRGAQPTLYGAEYQAEQQWGMAIDLTVCTGCSACVVACQAENNVPVVGKLGVQQQREMHWLRIDRYVVGSGAGARIATQPMLCQHCEAAPCEYVCPVNATVHSPDGLNEMIYNRCVGTRFCSNNCPYKVRRFNFYNYTAGKSETEKMAMNPDVTVRARGVMEKCTFCVQRIRRADIDSALSGTADSYARLQTACQQACPTRAIVFGSVADSHAPVAVLAGAAHSYQVLHELGTRPRVHYLAKLRNPNPALAEGAS